MDEELKGKFLENESQIVERAKASGQDFTMLYNFYFPKIYGYLYKRVGSRECAEDLTSQTFLKVFCNLKKYQWQGCGFGAWVYKIATNNLIDYYRKQGKHREVNLAELESLGDPDCSAEAKAQLAMEAKFINAAVKQLPANYQEVLHLKFFAQFSNEEIAQTLGTTVNNVRVLLYRSLKYFKQTYESNK